MGGKEEKERLSVSESRLQIAILQIQIRLRASSCRLRSLVIENSSLGFNEGREQKEIEFRSNDSNLIFRPRLFYARLSNELYRVHLRAISELEGAVKNRRRKPAETMSFE